LPAPTNGSNGDAAEASPRKKDYRDVMVTHVDEAGKLKIQQVGTGTGALTELMSAFKSFHLNKANDQPLPGIPKVGDIVAGKFTIDNEWYRAKVRRVDREGKKVDLTYLDYGNSETVPFSRLRPLSQPQFSTQKLKPQATDAVLSFLQLPTSQQYLHDTVDFIAEQTDGRQLVANVDYVAPEGTLHLTLLDPKVSTKIEESINAEVVREGLAMIPTKLKGWERQSADTLSRLGELQEEAKKGRRGMWEYGDLTED
jgi:staphylococcal nuclease domain-containing protein 1